jgi:hypothetical protein
VAARKAFLLRIDPALWDALERWAAEELRSVNGQIEYVLSRAVREAGRGRKAPRASADNDPGPGGAPGGPSIR